MGLPYLLTGTAVKRCNDVHPNQMSKPATWKFMTQLSHSLPNVGISPNIILTHSDLFGRDEYDFWKRSCSLSVIPQNGMDLPEDHRLHLEKWEATAEESLMDSNIVCQARDVEVKGDAHRHPYTAQVVQSSANDAPSTALVPPLGLYPEPPSPGDHKERPNGKKTRPTEKVANPYRGTFLLHFRDIAEKYYDSFHFSYKKWVDLTKAAGSCL